MASSFMMSLIRPRVRTPVSAVSARRPTCTQTQTEARGTRTRAGVRLQCPQETERATEAQISRFKEAARELQCDDSEQRFVAAVKKIGAAREGPKQRPQESHLGKTALSCFGTHPSLGGFLWMSDPTKALENTVAVDPKTGAGPELSPFSTGIRGSARGAGRERYSAAF